MPNKTEVNFGNGVVAVVDGEPSKEQVAAIWQDIQGQKTPDDELLPSDAKPSNRFGEILGQAVRSTPIGANLTQPGNYASAFTEGLGPATREALNVPKEQAGAMSTALRDPFNPIKSGAEIGRQVVTHPKDLAKATAAEAVGMATAPINYVIPAALEASELIPIGKTTIGKILELPPNRVKDAITGKLAPEVVDRFMSRIETLKKLRLPANIKNKPIGNIPEPESLVPATAQADIAKPSINIPAQKSSQNSFNSKFSGKVKDLAKSIREEYSGLKNKLIVEGNQFSDRIKRSVPDKAEREAMFWYKAARDKSLIQTKNVGEKDILEPVELRVQRILKAASEHPSFKKYKSQIQRGMSLSSGAKNALKDLDAYYERVGSESQQLGTINNIRENYQNRIYERPAKSDAIPSPLRKSTRHGKARIFPSEFHAVRFGKRFATTDVADLFSIYNEEMSRANTGRALVDAMSQHGIIDYFERGKAPIDWVELPGMRNGSKNAYAPEGLAKGLRAITDPDYTKKISVLRGLNKFQGVVKTVDLSFSFFHHFAMTMQSMFQGGTKTVAALMEPGAMEKLIAMPDFLALEQDFVRHTGITSKVEANQDVIRNLVEAKGWSQLPGVKQVLGTAQGSTEFLFGKLQRFLKVTDYGKKISNWVASHPVATDAEVKLAKTGFSKEINAAYGGLNWEAMGIDKSTLSLLRLGFLAPDWSISNVAMVKYALGADSGTPVAGAAARAHFLRAVVYGTVLTEGLNKIITGHFTDKNPKGHKLEVPIAPNVYVSFFKGAVGDAVKYSSMVAENGPIQGTSRFAQGKLAPVPRTAVGVLAGVDYTGRQIADAKSQILGNKQLGKTWDYFKYIMENTLPIPFGASTIWKYLTKEQKKTLLGGIGIVSGTARYSQSKEGNGASQSGQIRYSGKYK